METMEVFSFNENHVFQKTFLHPENTNGLKNYQMLGIKFLNECYNNELKGVILNVEENMDLPLQITVFLNQVFKSGLTLIISSNSLILHWYYNLVKEGNFTIKRVLEEDDCITGSAVDKNKPIIFLLDVLDLKLVENLINHNFFMIIIDDFDAIANKLLIKQLNNARFKIGLTKRNFYLNPEQKLQWNMLNWANPGRVGKLSKFYKIDNDNLINYRNNYRMWWIRITWGYCDSFKRPTEGEIQAHENIINDWAQKHNVINMTSLKPARNKTKQPLSIVKMNKNDDKSIKQKPQTEKKKTSNKGTICKQTVKKKSLKSTFNKEETAESLKQFDIRTSVTNILLEQNERVTELPVLETNLSTQSFNASNFLGKPNSVTDQCCSNIFNETIPQSFEESKKDNSDGKCSVSSEQFLRDLASPTFIQKYQKVEKTNFNQIDVSQFLKDTEFLLHD